MTKVPYCGLYEIIAEETNEIAVDKNEVVDEAMSLRLRKLLLKKLMKLQLTRMR